MIYSFLSFSFWPGSGSANLCGSGSGPGKNLRIRIRNTVKHLKYQTTLLTLGSGLMVGVSGVQLAGQTSPFFSTNWNALISLQCKRDKCFSISLIMRREVRFVLQGVEHTFRKFGIIALIMAATRTKWLEETKVKMAKKILQFEVYLQKVGQK